MVQDVMRELGVDVESAELDTNDWLVRSSDYGVGGICYEMRWLRKEDKGSVMGKERLRCFG